MKAPQQNRHKGNNAHRGPFIQRMGRHHGAQEDMPFISRKRVPTVQPKLTIGQPGDKYEQEADQMADRVMRMPMSGAANPIINRMHNGTPDVQRMCSQCEDEVQRMPTDDVESEEEMLSQGTPQSSGLIVQRMADGEEMHASHDITSRIQNRRGQGEALPPDMQMHMEDAFDADLSGVRVHTDSESVRMNQELNSQAFTHGSDVYFDQGKYDPHSSSGRRLLVHELTHTVQQSKNAEAVNIVQRQTGERIRRGRSVQQNTDLYYRTFENFRNNNQDFPQPFRTEIYNLFQNHDYIVTSLAEYITELNASRISPVIQSRSYSSALARLSDAFQEIFVDGFTVSRLYTYILAVSRLHSEIPTIAGIVFQQLERIRSTYDEFLTHNLSVRQAAGRIMGNAIFVEVQGKERTAVAERGVADRTQSQPRSPVRRTDADNIYIREIIENNVSPDGQGGWRIFAPRAIPAMKLFVRSRAIAILQEQQNHIIERRNMMRRSLHGASSSERAAIVENVRRARIGIRNAEELRENLRADATEAQRLGRLTSSVTNEQGWEILVRISERRSMQGLNDEQLPSNDRTRELMREGYQQRIQEGWRHRAIIPDIAHYVVRVERNRQIQAVTDYINGIYQGMPFLRHVIENDLRINATTLNSAVESGYQEAREANRQARNAISGARIDAFSMQPAVEAALARLPDYIRSEMRRLIEEERSQESIIHVLESIGITAGLVLLAFVPVIGPQLAFAAGVADTARSEAEIYFRNVVSDTALSPEEDMEDILGVVRPDAFEEWITHLGPILDVGFAVAGPALRAATRRTREARAALSTSRVEAEIVEAGIPTLSAAEGVSNLGRQADQVNELLLGSRRSTLRGAISTPTRRLRNVARQLDEEDLSRAASVAGTRRSGEELVEATESTQRAITDAGRSRRATERGVPAEPEQHSRTATEASALARPDDTRTPLSIGGRSVRIGFRNGRFDLCASPCEEFFARLEAVRNTLPRNDPLRNGIRRLRHDIRTSVRRLENGDLTELQFNDLLRRRMGAFLQRLPDEVRRRFLMETDFLVRNGHVLRARSGLRAADAARERGRYGGTGPDEVVAEQTPLERLTSPTETLEGRPFDLSTEDMLAQVQRQFPERQFDRLRRTEGSNEVEWILDENGYPVGGRAILRRREAPSGRRPGSETQAQGEAASRGIPGDQGGHAFGYRFLGPQGHPNLFPQAGNLNQGAYNQLEREWANRLLLDYEVHVEIKLIPIGSARPTHIIYEYQVFDPRDGLSLVHSEAAEFANIGGMPSLGRVPIRDM